MGHLSNPIINRLGVSFLWSSRWSSFLEKNFSYFLSEDFLLEDLFYFLFILNKNSLFHADVLITKFFIFRTFNRFILVFTSFPIYIKSLTYYIREFFLNLRSIFFQAFKFRGYSKSSENFLNLLVKGEKTNKFKIKNFKRRYKNKKSFNLVRKSFFRRFSKNQKKFFKNIKNIKKFKIIDKVSILDNHNFLFCFYKVILIRLHLIFFYIRFFNLESRFFSKFIFFKFCLKFLLKSFYFKENFNLFERFERGDDDNLIGFHHKFYPYSSFFNRNLFLCYRNIFFYFYLFWVSFFVHQSFLLMCNIIEEHVKLLNFNKNNFYIVMKEDILSLLSAQFLADFMRKRFMQNFTVYDFIGRLLRHMRNTLYFSGFKVIFSGRYSKRTRSKLTIYKKGSLPLNTLSIPVDYGFSSYATKFGVCGIKIFLFKSAFFFNNSFFKSKLELFKNSKLHRSRQYVYTKIQGCAYIF